MTRDEFLEIDSWSDLLYFCSNEGCSICDDICHEDDRDDYINECLTDMARDAYDWKDLRDTLDNINTGWDYYRRDEYDGEWIGLDGDDFGEYLNDVLEWGDEEEVWDEPDEDEDEDANFAQPIDPYAYSAEEAEEEFDPWCEEDEEISYTSLFESCVETFECINQRKADEAREEALDFIQAFVAC